MKNNKKEQKERGITLVALVITIVILIILSVVTINMAFGDNGLVKYAEKARDKTANSTIAEAEGINSMVDQFANVMAEDSEIPLPDTRSEIEKARYEGTVFEEKTELKDKHGNKVKVPAGFKIASDSGITIQQGIVIEDVSASTDVNIQGSQYVWIPVGIFKKDDGTTSGNIQLGRYTFDISNGKPKLYQDATNYLEETYIQITDEVADEFYTAELSIYREGIISIEADGLNATAKDLKHFIDSVNTNGGYYIGRYEATYVSGADDNNNVDNYDNCKAASKISTYYSTNSMSYNIGTLWNYINQVNASKVSINTYANSTSVISDLLNSYAWDTAIVYVQEAGNINYANAGSKSSNLLNTGTVGDEVCKINDMASNLAEWTTEYSSYIHSNASVSPCIARGGYSFYEDVSIYKVQRRLKLNSNLSNLDVGFRLLLYIP